MPATDAQNVYHSVAR